jgi:hypothetical protein
MVVMVAGLLFLGVLDTRLMLHGIGVGAGAGILIGLVSVVGVAWVIGAFLLRIASDVEVTTGELRWRTPLRRGTVPLHELRAVRMVVPFFPLGAVAVETDDGTRVWLLTELATSQLVDHLRTLVPQLEVSWVARRFRGSAAMHSYTRLG